jgi:hypothetical protein
MPIVIASSFADPKDVAAYNRAKAEGKTEKEALKIGDNGIGVWGDKTARDDVSMCALPPEDWKAKWRTGHNARGKKVSVTFNGKTVIGELRDTLPDKAHNQNGAGIDLNPGFAKAFGVTPPFMLHGVRWEWVIDSHNRLFGESVYDAITALNRPVPTQVEYPDNCAREYAEIAVSKIRQTSGMRVGWPPFIEQGLRLLILENIFKARGMLIPPEMQACIDRVKKSSEITSTIGRAHK